MIGVDGLDAVCFNAPVVELHRGTESRRRDAVLGPDLCHADADIDECVVRLGHLRQPGTPIADALLDQRVACGVGNVFKSEALWAERIHPLTSVERLPDDVRRALLATAAGMLRANLAGARRATVPGGLAVYGRAGRPCRRCGTSVVSRRVGEHARVTFWCPSCQSAPL